MKAIQFNASVPRYAAGMALGKAFPSLLWSGLSCTYAADVDEPTLPTDEWVMIKTRYGGVCGSDLSAIHLRVSPYYSPFSSYPFTLGHENVGRIAEVGPCVEGWEVGERVVVEPTLWCRPRGFANLCVYCARGEINRCERVTEGNLPPGLFAGSCHTTGGSWGARFVAHSAQLYRVPESVSDENALMIEPFACSLHAVLQNPPHDDETVLIVGAGTIGLCALAAIRAIGSACRAIVLARHPAQVEAARRLGASDVIPGGADHFEEVARLTGGKLLKPIIGKRVMVGGADRTYVCAGSDSAVDDGLRLTRSGGRVVLVSLPGIAKRIDWSAIFAQELTLSAAYAYHHAEQFQGETWSTFGLTLDLMARGNLDLGWMVTHRFRIDDYAQAFRLHSQRGQSGIIKAVFAFE